MCLIMGQAACTAIQKKKPHEIGLANIWNIIICSLFKSYIFDWIDHDPQEVIIIIMDYNGKYE